MKKILITLILLIVAINLFAYSLEGKYDWTKPTKRIYPGIDLAGLALEDPFVNVYCVRIDLTKGFKYYTTPPLTEEENFKIDLRYLSASFDNWLYVSLKTSPWELGTYGLPQIKTPPSI